MPETPGPAQVAYTAYCLFWCRYGFGERALVPWSALTPEMHGAWEAAAQAVLALREEEPLDVLPSASAWEYVNAR